MSLECILDRDGVSDPLSWTNLKCQNLRVNQVLTYTGVETVNGIIFGNDPPPEVNRRFDTYTKIRSELDLANPAGNLNGIAGNATFEAIGAAPKFLEFNLIELDTYVVFEIKPRLDSYVRFVNNLTSANSIYALDAAKIGNDIYNKLVGFITANYVLPFYGDDVDKKTVYTFAGLGSYTSIADDGVSLGLNIIFTYNTAENRFEITFAPVDAILNPADEILNPVRQLVKVTFTFTKIVPAIAP